MKKSRFVLQVFLLAVLSILFITERYTAEKAVDMSRHITTKSLNSPLKSHLREHRRLSKHGDKVSSILNKMKAAGLPVYDDEFVPYFDDSRHNGAEDLKAALEMISQSKEGSAIYDLSALWKAKSKLSSEELKKISDLLNDASVSELLDLARQASEKDYLAFGLDYSKGPGLELPHLGAMRNLMRIISLKSFADLEEGRNVEAVQNLNVALKLNSMPGDDITLIGELVENAVTGILNENVNELRTAGADLSETYKILENSLAQAHENQLKTIDGERHYFGSWFFDKVLNSPDDLQKEELKSLFGKEINDISPAEVKEQYANYLEVMFEVRELMEEPYYLNAEKLKAKEKNEPKSGLLKELLPAYSKIYKKFHESQSLMKKNLLAMKVGEYEKKYGAKPERLDILNVPEDYLIDNITGKPFLLISNTGGDVVITHVDDKTGGVKL